MQRIKAALEEEVIEATEIADIEDIISQYIEDISRGGAEMGFDVYDDINDIIEQGGREVEEDSEGSMGELEGAVQLMQGEDAVVEEVQGAQPQLELQVEPPSEELSPQSVQAGSAGSASASGHPGREISTNSAASANAADLAVSAVGAGSTGGANNVNNASAADCVKQQQKPQATEQRIYQPPALEEALQQARLEEQQSQSQAPASSKAPGNQAPLFTITQRPSTLAQSKPPVLPQAVSQTSSQVAPNAAKVVEEQVLYLKPTKSAPLDHRDVQIAREAPEPHVQTKIFKVLSTAPGKNRLNLNAQPNNELAPAVPEQVLPKVFSRQEIADYFNEYESPGLISFKSEEELQLIRENALFVAETRSVYQQYHNQCVSLSLRQVPLLQKFDNLPVQRATPEVQIQLSDPALQRRLEAAKQVLKADPIGALAVRPPKFQSVQQTGSEAGGLVSVQHCFESEVGLFDENVAEVAFYTTSFHTGRRNAALAACSLRNRGWRWSPHVARWVMAEDGRVRFYDPAQGIKETDVTLSGCTDVF